MGLNMARLEHDPAHLECLYPLTIRIDVLDDLCNRDVRPTAAGHSYLSNNQDESHKKDRCCHPSGNDDLSHRLRSEAVVCTTSRTDLRSKSSR